MTRCGYKARAPLAVAVLSLAAGVASAQKADFKFERDCADWIEKHGYSTDYIKLKTGKRQRGAAAEWRGNVEVKEVQPGDVVLSYMKDKDKAMRVAYVDEVRRNPDGSPGAVLVSEWNDGPYINEACNATDHFGRASAPRPITIDAVVRVWRPSLPL